MVRVIDGTEQETAEGGGGAEGNEGGAADGDFTAQLRAAASVESHNVPTLRARDNHSPRQDPHCRLSWSAAAPFFFTHAESSLHLNQKSPTFSLFSFVLFFPFF